MYLRKKNGAPKFNLQPGGLNEKFAFNLVDTEGFSTGKWQLCILVDTHKTLVFEVIISQSQSEGFQYKVDNPTPDLVTALHNLKNCTTFADYDKHFPNTEKSLYSWEISTFKDRWGQQLLSISIGLGVIAGAVIYFTWPVTATKAQLVPVLHSERLPSPDVTFTLGNGTVLKKGDKIGHITNSEPRADLVVQAEALKQELQTLEKQIPAFEKNAAARLKKETELIKTAENAVKIAEEMVKADKKDLSRYDKANLKSAYVASMFDERKRKLDISQANLVNAKSQLEQAKANFDSAQSSITLNGNNPKEELRQKQEELRVLEEQLATFPKQMVSTCESCMYLQDFAQNTNTPYYIYLNKVDSNGKMLLEIAFTLKATQSQDLVGKTGTIDIGDQTFAFSDIRLASPQKDFRLPDNFVQSSEVLLIGQIDVSGLTNENIVNLFYRIGTSKLQ
jgi:hypothetical protein